MLKKSVYILVIFLGVSLFSGCKKETRIDFSELLIRTQRYHGEIEADFGDAFFSEDSWYIFLSSLEGDDTLLKATQDGNKYLVFVELTVANSGVEGNEQAFIKLAEAVTKAFCDLDNTKAFLEEGGLYEENIIFSREFRCVEKGRYTLSFFNSSLSSSLILEIE